MPTSIARGTGNSFSHIQARSLKLILILNKQITKQMYIPLDAVCIYRPIPVPQNRPDLFSKFIIYQDRPWVLGIWVSGVFFSHIRYFGVTVRIFNILFFYIFGIWHLDTSFWRFFWYMNVCWHSNWNVFNRSLPGIGNGKEWIKLTDRIAPKFIHSVFGCINYLSADGPTIPISLGLPQFCLKISNPDNGTSMAEHCAGLAIQRPLVLSSNPWPHL